jgi:hypothetical protein
MTECWCLEAGLLDDEHPQGTCLDCPNPLPKPELHVEVVVPRRPRLTLEPRRRYVRHPSKLPSDIREWQL